MTVRELIELNQMICDLVIEVREGGGRLIDYYAIGDAMYKPKYPMRVPRKPEYFDSNRFDDTRYREGTYKPVSINTFDDGKDYWQVKVKRVPEYYLNLQVYSWDCTRAYSGIGMRGKVGSFEGKKICVIALPNGTPPPAEETPKPKADEQMAGQITLDTLEGI